MSTRENILAEIVELLIEELEIVGHGNARVVEIARDVLKRTS